MHVAAERHLHRFEANGLVEVRRCPSCADKVRFGVYACTRCPDFTLFRPLDFPRMCRG